MDCLLVSYSVIFTMNNSTKYILLFLISFSFTQEIITEYVIENGDTLDVFSYQIPAEYTGNDAVPLLVAFHQWGGNENSNYFTEFDEEANLRGWFFLSPYGGSPNNYHHQGAQYFTQQAIIWLQENFYIDSQRIYMVGGSMGGAGGAIFANNHLDPNFPMVAATASASGILDCERRYWEMDGNNSMIEWFGGTPEEVPFEYHRNSAVFFPDSLQSNHYNLQHTALYFDFSENEAHRWHAEDLYTLLLGYNENMWIETDPDPSGHGYSMIDEIHACDWLSQFSLVDDPDNVNVNLDEPSRAYWLEAFDQISEEEFIRIIADRVNESTFILHYLNNSEAIFLYPSGIFESIFVTTSNSRSFSLGLPADDSFSEIQLFQNGSLIAEQQITDDNIWVDIPFAGDYEIRFISSIPPDPNNDGSWNVLDLVLVVNFIIGSAIPDEYEQNASDINQDGMINVLDLVVMVNLIVGD
jgi:hypothetical protein